LTTLQDVEWLPPLADKARNAELERYVKRKVGSAPPHTAYFADCPWIMRADIQFDIGGAHIHELQDLMYLVVSRDNSCRFCHGAARLFMRLAGMSEARIDQLEEDVETARADPRTSRAMNFARKVSRSNPSPGPEDYDALREAGFSEDGIHELALFAGIVVFHNRFSTLLALPPEPAERMASSRFARILRIPFRRILSAVNSKGAHEALGQSMHQGPFGFVTGALDGLPHARALRSVIDEAWASPQLPVRSKALVFAVIARGLGSLDCEREARRLLAAEDEVFTVDAVDDMLANLASPLLTAAEARILPYVRETIRYQPAPVQRRGRALREKLNNAEFVETVGAAALANMVCRIALATDPR